MLRGRKQVTMLTAAALLVLAAVAGPATFRQLVHGRDTRAFHSAVTAYVGGWSSSHDPSGPQRDEAWVAAHPAQVLAEGNRACDWLASRPTAPDRDPTGDSSVFTLMGRYLRATEHDRLADLSVVGRETVVANAWASLCWWTRRDKTAPRGYADD
jgi:hypothetical protein